MKSDTALDYAVFQLSPKRSRCELFVSSDGSTEKLASGLVKPFVAHLKVAEEQVASAFQSIKLDVGRGKNAETWFTKGTLERFVRFVSTPEVLEVVNTLDAEMSQLEGARRIYSQGSGDQFSGGGSTVTTTADATKKELLRAIDVRLGAVQQDLVSAHARASAAGFNIDSIRELQMFANCFGAHRLNEACSKFVSLCERRQELINPWKVGMADDRAIRSSYGSDMSIDEDQYSPQDLRKPATAHCIIPDSDLTQHQQQPKIFMSQQQTPTSSVPSLQGSRESSTEKDETGTGDDSVCEKEKKEESCSSDQGETSQATHPMRRLSVQDRINLFENKQKESSSKSGGKPTVGKSVELRRMSSDVSSSPAAVEKAVLRRWSGASDMSIDLSGERKDNTESPQCTPSAASVSQTKFEDKNDMNMYDKPESGKPGSEDEIATHSSTGVMSRRTDIAGGKQSTVSLSKSEDSSGSLKSHSDKGTAENNGAKDQALWKMIPAPSTTMTEHDNTKDRPNSLSYSSDGKAKQIGLADRQKFQSYDKHEPRENDYPVDSDTHIAEVKEQVGGPLMKFRASGAKPSDSRSVAINNHSEQVEFPNKKEEVGSRGYPAFVSQSHLGPSQGAAGDSGQLEGGPGSKVKEAFAAQYIQAADSSSQPRWRSLGESEVFKKKDVEFEQVHDHSLAKNDDSELRKFKHRKPIPREQIKNVLAQRDEATSSLYGASKNQLSDEMVMDAKQGFGHFSSQSSVQVQKPRQSKERDPNEELKMKAYELEKLRPRQSKANQELNDELKMKANELEKLFAEHKLRAPADQSNSVRRNKPIDMQNETPASLSYNFAADTSSARLLDGDALNDLSGSSNMADFPATPPIRIDDNQNSGDALNKSFAELNFLDTSRGKLYVQYMQKRDAKLREEWGSKRAEKEAKLKAMQDSFERGRAELKAKLSGYEERQGSVFSARRRAERLRSFNMRSITKRKQQHLDFGQSDDDDETEFPEQHLGGEAKSFVETSIGDGVSKSTQAKKFLPAKSLSSSTPRTSAAPIPRSTIKAPSVSSGRRRMQPENPLAQSVPNFSDMRKENTKPSAVSKTARSQVRNYARSKSSSEEVATIKEDKSRRSQSLRKSSVNLNEFRESSPQNSESVSLTPLEDDVDEKESSPSHRFSKNMESRPFLKIGSGKDFGSRPHLPKRKGSMASDIMKNEDEYDDLTLEIKESVDVEYEDDFNINSTEGHLDLDKGERLSQESEKMVNSGSENEENVRCFSQIDQSLGVNLPSALPSSFHPVDSVQDSPGESPFSWNSRIHNPFSYPHEMSDFDASADSPLGSPASWNSHMLSQAETDAARMRKKWGIAQKPMLVANSSHNHSRKDMTRGFKRLLKFGRKSRGTESLVDWISATTSEGDDDTEDGRDPANRSSEDLRKSRMGFSQGQPSDDSFNESEYFNEQVQLQSSIPAPPANFKLREEHLSGSSMKAPRSFFSLSSFRSKGNDSKPR